MQQLAEERKEIEMNVHSKENQSQEGGVLAQKFNKKPKKQMHQNVGNAEEDEEDREIDSQTMQNAQHGDSLFFTLFPGFKISSWTFALCSIQIIGYLIVLFLQIHLGVEEKCSTFLLGGRYTYTIAKEYQFHREIISIFFHSDAILLFMNIFTTFIYGFVLEAYYLKKKYLFVYFTSGFLGNLFSSYFSLDKPYGGAGCAVYGLYGMNILYMIEHYEYMGEERNSNFKNFFWIVLACLMLFFLDEEVDSAGLPIAFLYGFLLSILFYKKEGRIWTILRITVVTTALILAIVMIILITQLDIDPSQDVLDCKLFDQIKKNSQNNHSQSII